MFGFHGQHVAKLDYTQHGARTGSGSGKRSMDFIGTALFGKFFGKAIFDVNNESGTLPETQDLNGEISTAFVAGNSTMISTDASLSGNVSVGPQSGFYGLALKIIQVNGITRGQGWTFNVFDNTLLSPPTRRNQFLVENPSTLRFIAFQATANIVSSTHNKGHTFIGNKLDLRQFPNLQAASIFDVYQTDVLMLFPDSLKNLTLNPKCSNILAGSKLPKNLETFEGFWDKPDTGNITIPADFFADCNLTSLFLWRATNPVQFPSNVVLRNKLTGTIDASHMTNLKEFAFGGNTVLTSISLPTGKTDWEIFLLQSLNNAIVTALGSVVIEDILDSPTLKTFIVISNSFVKNRAIDNADISGSLVYFWLYQNSWSGNITITAPRPNLKEFKTGNITLRTGTQQNSHPVVDLTGLTNAGIIDLSGSDCADLQLPVNTVMTSLFIYANKLDIGTNPNLITQINAITSLTDLRIGNVNLFAAAPTEGQDSVNGFGNNPSFAGLVNMTRFYAGNTKITGVLTLPNVNKLTDLRISDVAITGITNLSAHSSLASLYFLRMPNFTADFSGFTSYTGIFLRAIANVSINISGRTSTTLIQPLVIDANPNLTDITLPAGLNTCRFSATDAPQIRNNPLLTTINNLGNIAYTNTAASGRIFFAEGNALNIAFPFSNTFNPAVITIQNNGMSQANVDATVDNHYAARASYAGITGSKSANIAGSNAAPSGVYQAPAGFVLGSNDGAPATAKEKIYVMVNNYGWTYTYN